MKGTLAFGFKDNLTEDILALLEVDSKVLLNVRAGVSMYIKLDGKKFKSAGASGIFDTFGTELLQEISEHSPKHILGLGRYSGRDRSQIRIETKCTNKFRNNVLGQELKSLEIPYFITPDENFKLAIGIGNSFCNLISYKITEFIRTSDIDTKYIFLHIPEGYDISTAARLINRKLILV